MDALRAKLQQRESGWDANHLDYGVLLTTDACGLEGAKLIEQHDERPDHPILLIDGEDLSRFLCSTLTSLTYLRNNPMST